MVLTSGAGDRCDLKCGVRGPVTETKVATGIHEASDFSFISGGRGGSKARKQREPHFG